MTSESSGTVESAKVLPPPGLFAAEAYAFGGSVLATVAAMLLSNAMTTAAYGEYGAALGALQIASTFCGLGLGAIAAIEIRRDRGLDELGLARGFTRIVPILIVAASVLTAVLLSLGHALIHQQTAVRLESFISVIAVLPIFALGAYLLCEAPIHSAGASATFARRIVAPSISIVIVAAVLVVGTSLSVLGAAAILAITQLVALCCSALAVHRRKSADLASGYREYNVPGWLRKGGVYLVPMIAGIILDRGGIVMLGWLHVDAEGAARYFAASTLAIVPFALASTARGQFSPAFAALGDNANSVASVYAEISSCWRRKVVPVVLATAVAIAVFGPLLLSLFGSEFRAAYWTLLVLLALYTFVGMNRHVTRSLQNLGYAKVVNIAMIVWTVVGLVLMAVLGFSLSAFGVALGEAIALACFVVTAKIKMRRVTASSG